VVTKLRKSIKVYINGTAHTLTPEYTTFEVNGKSVPLPYKEKHMIHVRIVAKSGRKYTCLSAWAGVDIWFTDGDIQLAVDGFYMNEVAGYCGNVNYKPEDDLVPRDMTSQWEAGPMAGLVYDTREERRSSTCSPSDVSLGACDVFLSNVLSAAYDDVGVAGFISACHHDVSRLCCPFHSIRAYLTAAHAKQVDVDACVCGDWGEWSDCDATNYQ
jgi:hypothetical protein